MLENRNKNIEKNVLIFKKGKISILIEIDNLKA